MKCIEYKKIFCGCIRKEDINVYYELIHSGLINKPCIPNSTNKYIFDWDGTNKIKIEKDYP